MRRDGGITINREAMRRIMEVWSDELPHALLACVRSFVGEVLALRAGGRAPERYRWSRIAVRWQWLLFLLSWLMQRAGIARTLVDDKATGEMLLSEAGFNAQAKRGGHFSEWRRGRAAMAPGDHMPGEAAASDANADKYAKTCLRHSRAALIRLTEEGMKVLSTRIACPGNGGAGGGDVVMGEGDSEVGRSSGGGGDGV